MYENNEGVQRHLLEDVKLCLRHLQKCSYKTFMAGRDWRMCVVRFNIHLMFVSKSMHETTWTHLMRLNLLIKVCNQVIYYIFIYKFKNFNIPKSFWKIYIIYYKLYVSILYCIYYIIGQFINNYLHFIELNDPWKTKFLVYFCKDAFKNLKVNFF